MKLDIKSITAIPVLFALSFGAFATWIIVSAERERQAIYVSANDACGSHGYSTTRTGDAVYACVTADGTLKLPKSLKAAALDASAGPYDPSRFDRKTGIISQP